MSEAFKELLTILTSPQPYTPHFKLWQETNPELNARIDRTAAKIRDSGIFKGGELKVGEFGKGEPCPINNLEGCILQLALEIEVNADRQNSENEQGRIKSDFGELYNAYDKAISNLFFWQGHVQRKNKRSLKQVQTLAKKILRIQGELEELEIKALSCLSPDPKGRPLFDLRDRLAETLKNYAPSAKPSTISFRISELFQELELFHSEPDAIRQRIKRRQ